MGLKGRRREPNLWASSPIDPIIYASPQFHRLTDTRLPGPVVGPGGCRSDIAAVVVISFRRSWWEFWGKDPCPAAHRRAAIRGILDHVQLFSTVVAVLFRASRDITRRALTRFLSRGTHSRLINLARLCGTLTRMAYAYTGWSMRTRAGVLGHGYTIAPIVFHCRVSLSVAPVFQLWPIRWVRMLRTASEIPNNNLCATSDGT